MKQLKTPRVFFNQNAENFTRAVVKAMAEQQS